MSGSKSEEEREFYMRLAIKERYSKRQLERQMDKSKLYFRVGHFKEKAGIL
jgi:predicted nuclease of restriction endonuclease-like (RecB) superfamily